MLTSLMTRWKVALCAAAMASAPLAVSVTSYPAVASVVLTSLRMETESSTVSIFATPNPLAHTHGHRRVSFQLEPNREEIQCRRAWVIHAPGGRRRRAL